MNELTRHHHLQVYGVLAAFLVFLVALLSFPVALPMGESFWDTYIYIDGAHRMAVGQEIYRDFHAPVGPLNYVLFNVMSSLFPDGNVVFAIQWSLMLVTVPVIACICWHALERGAGAAFALLLPYLLFSILPFNDTSWNAFPGVDGFAYYNRHSAVLLYLLTASLFYVRSQVTLVVLVSVLLLALAFIKINAFLAAGMILAVALVTRRIGVRASLSVAVLCLSFTALLELGTGVVSAYLASVFPAGRRQQFGTADPYSDHRHGPVRRHLRGLAAGCLSAAGALAGRRQSGGRIRPGYAPQPGAQPAGPGLDLGRDADRGQHPVRIAEFRQRRLHLAVAVAGGAVPGNGTRPARQAVAAGHSHCPRCTAGRHQGAALSRPTPPPRRSGTCRSTPSICPRR